MSLPDDHSPVGDDEILYRRIPISRGYHQDDLPISPEAFQPHPVNDTTGLSLVRGGEFNTPAEAGQGPAKQGYHLVVVRAGTLRSLGIEVVSAPVDGVSGHVEIPALRSENRDSTEALEMMRKLAQASEEVLQGPFAPP